MGYEDKILWNEGMFLGPHHFQQADRHRDFVLRRRIANLSRFHWGLGALELNHDALAGGDVRILECQAVLPGGLVIDVPDHDEAPQSRSLEDFFHGQMTHVGVFLAVPSRVPGKAVTRIEDEDRGCRFRGDYVSVADENTDGRERELLVARTNLKILFEGEPLDGYDTIEIAKVARDTSGKFHLDQAFLPTAYALAASKNLLPLLRRLITNLSNRRENLNAQRRRSGTLARFAPSEAATFWLLHTINLHLPVLQHFESKNPQAHPEQLYLELLRLAGGLATFSEDFSFDDLEYQHEKQTEVFGPLEAAIERLLETVIPQRSTVIDLIPTSESVFTGEIDAKIDLSAFEFFLAVRSDVGEDKLIKEIPIKAKISSQDRLRDLLTAAVRGIPIRHRPNPSTDIFEPGRTYFEFEKTGTHWEAVAQERTVSVYIPPEFTDVRVELILAKE